MVLHIFTSMITWISLVRTGSGDGSSFYTLCTASTRGQLGPHVAINLSVAVLEKEDLHFFPLICKLQKYVPRAGKTVLFACRSTQTRTQSTSSSVIARGSIPSLISLGKYLDGWNRFY